MVGLFYFYAMNRILALFLFLIPFALCAQNDVWWKQTAVYQIYPRSFNDTDGDGIGDLKGIIYKLDYIKNLGFETIWVSPFFKSPQGDFGYDVADYRSIAPEYGDMATCQLLIDEAHKKGMRVVFDLVMNHTSDQHEWFQNSKSSLTAEKRDWYIWRDGKKPNGKRPPNNWKSMIGGNGWHYDETTGQWYWATFLPFQPDLNYHNPEVKKAMLDVARFWLDKGVDGFRLDIFNTIYEDASFKDNPFSLKMIPGEENPNGYFQKVKYTQNQSGSFEFAKELRAVMDEYAEPKFTVGEVFGDVETLRKFCGENADGLHSIFLFKTLKTKMKAKPLYKMIEEFETTFPDPYIPTYVYSNHDKVRSISRYKDNEKLARLQAILQFTVRGIPFTYYGEEIGMKQAYIPLKEGKDPLAQKYEKMPQWLINMSGQSLNRDECRTPMQWGLEGNANFCREDVAPWLPLNDDQYTVNVEAMNMDTNSLYHFYKDLVNLNQGSEILKLGSMELLGYKKGVLSYSRKYKEKEIVVLLNFSKKSRKVNVKQGVQFFSTYPDIPTIQNGNISLRPLEGVIILDEAPSSPKD